MWVISPTPLHQHRCVANATVVMVMTASKEGMASYARTWACGQVSSELGRDRRHNKGMTGPLRRRRVMSLSMGDGKLVKFSRILAYSSVLTLTINKVTCCQSSSYTDNIINPVPCPAPFQSPHNPHALMMMTMNVNLMPPHNGNDNTRVREPKTIALIFASSKMVIMDMKSEDDSRPAS